MHIDATTFFNVVLVKSCSRETMLINFLGLEVDIEIVIIYRIFFRLIVQEANKKIDKMAKCEMFYR